MTESGPPLSVLPLVQRIRPLHHVHDGQFSTLRQQAAYRRANPWQPANRRREAMTAWRNFIKRRRPVGNACACPPNGGATFTAKCSRAFG